MTVCASAWMASPIAPVTVSTRTIGISWWGRRRSNTLTGGRTSQCPSSPKQPPWPNTAKLPAKPAPSVERRVRVSVRVVEEDPYLVAGAAVVQAIERQVGAGVLGPGHALGSSSSKVIATPLTRQSWSRRERGIVVA